MKGQKRTCLFVRTRTSPPEIVCNKKAEPRIVERKANPASLERRLEWLQGVRTQRGQW